MISYSNTELISVKYIDLLKGKHDFPGNYICRKDDALMIKYYIYLWLRGPFWAEKL
jgi:hypothetical protein